MKLLPAPKAKLAPDWMKKPAEPEKLTLQIVVSNQPFIYTIVLDKNTSHYRYFHS